MPEYNYVVIRKDLSIAQQVVQVGHVCMRAGVEFGNWDANMCLFQVDNQEQLKNVVKRLEKLGKRFVVYTEDEPVGITAVCTAAGPRDESFRGFFMYKGDQQ